MTNPCKATRNNGQPCQAPAGEDGYCFGHSPRLAAARRAGSSRGGRHKRSEARAAKMLPEVLRPVLHSVLGAMARVDRGLMDPRQGTAIAALASAAVKVFQAGLIEDKVRELEELTTRHIS